MFVKGYHPSDAMSLCSAAMERAAPFFLGALAAIGFAPFGIWPATIIALVLLFRTIGSASSVREVIGKSWWFGFGLGMASLPWLAQAFTFQSSMPPWLGWAAVALLAAYTALYWAMPLGFAFLVSRRSSPLIFAMQASAAFMVGEWLRGIILTGFPWNPLAAIWSDVPALVRGAAVIGSLGLSGATILLTALIAAAAGRGGARPPLVLTTVIALALLAIAVMPPL
ncbi:MAG TPA: hypothetical protein VFL97_06110, partial [Nitrococcus sp.]|nr:hypothetical protein [Nitrococcus sp.]